MTDKPHKIETSNTRKAYKSKSPVKSSYFWAFIFLFAIAGWMASGNLEEIQNLLLGQEYAEKKSSASVGASSPVRSEKDTAQNKQDLFKVRVKTFTAQARNAELTIRGRTQVDARVEVKAQTAGVVEKLPIQKGSKVRKGDILCQVETAERQATHMQAKANVAKVQADYNANFSLAKKGFTAQLRMSSLKAELDAAKALLKRAEIDLERTKLIAPFNGVIEEQQAEIGDYLAVGSTCATLVALDPLIVVGTVSELDIGNLKKGMVARVQLVTGDSATGKISFISSSADIQTRTFRIEVTINNEKQNLRDGVTTDIFIPLPSKPAQLLPPSILVLNNKGQVGVRIIESENRIAFKPVKILSDTPKGIWVSGLPERVRIVTVGQDFVIPGQEVSVTEIIAEHDNTKPNES